MNSKKLLRTIIHPTTIKIVIVFLIVSYFFILPTHAATTNASLENFKGFLSNILGVCSRLWIILSILAGKLMTNDRVYGSILHMDIYLRKIWNIMKNFANFTLAGIVLRNIVSNLVGKKGMDIKDLITKTLIAGVLIQASWFLVGALVDVSTIATSAVGAFPASFLKTDAKLQKNIQDSLKETPKNIVIDMENINEQIETVSTDNTINESARNDVLPTYNSVSWPLLYLWFSVFKFQNYMNVGYTHTGTEITIAFLLRLVLILMYTLWLALLFIANIIRVVFLWIFVIGAPLIILSRLFFKDAGLWWSSSKWIGKYLKFSVMVSMIFKPVIFVAGFWFIIILVASMQNIMQWSIPSSFNGVDISMSDWASTLSVAWISSVEVKENGVLGEDVTAINDIKDIWQSIFVNLIIFFLTIFLVWQFIKISLTTGEWPIQNVMKPLTKFIEDTFKTLPLLPLGKGASLSSASQFFESSRKKTFEWMGINTKGQFWELGEDWRNFTTHEEQFTDFLNDKMGLQKWRKDSDRKELNSIAKKGEAEAFFAKTRELANSRDWGLTITNGSWNTAFLTLMKKKSFGNLPQAGSNITTADAYFQKLNSENIKTLYTELWGNNAAPNSTTPKKYDELKNITFYPNSQK